MSETGARLLRAHRSLCDARSEIEDAINRFEVTEQKPHSPITWIRMHRGLKDTQESIDSVASALRSLCMGDEEEK